MKLGKLLLAGIIALGLVACNNKEEIDLSGQPESTVSVRVMPSSHGPVLKSTGDLSGTGIQPAGLVAESAIKQLEVYVFAGEAPDGYKSETGENVTQVLDVATHSGAKTIVVVANAGIGAVTSKTALLAKTKDLPVTIASGLPMTSAETAVTLVAGKNQYGFSASTSNYAPTANQISTDNPLKVTRINARVAIVGAQLGDLPAGQTAIFDALSDVQVAMFNVPKTSKLFGTSLAMNADFLFGQAWPSPQATYTAGTANAAFLDGTVTFPIVNTAAPYYYVTENTSTAAKEQMFIVLRGKPMKDGVAVVAEGLYTDADGYTYYPVWVNANKAGYTYAEGYTADSKVLRNTQYNITLTIKKIGNPTIDEAVEAQLDVQVEVMPWTVVNQAVEW